VTLLGAERFGGGGPDGLWGAVWGRCHGSFAGFGVVGAPPPAVGTKRKTESVRETGKLKPLHQRGAEAHFAHPPAAKTFQQLL
jgi:hypothetical protein